MDFKRKEGRAMPMSFLPLDMSFDLIAPGPLKLPMTPSNTPGFVGYAIHMISLREEHEHLRMSVIWALFKDLAVFATQSAAEDADRQWGKKHFMASLKESRELPDPKIAIASEEWRERIWEGNYGERLREARERKSRALEMLNRRQNCERRAQVAEAKKRAQVAEAKKHE